MLSLIDIKYKFNQNLVKTFVYFFLIVKSVRRENLIKVKYFYIFNTVIVKIVQVEGKVET